MNERTGAPNLEVWKRARAYFAVGLALIATGGLLSLGIIARIDRSTSQLLQGQETILRTEAALLALADMVSEGRGYYATGDPGFLQRFNASRDSLADAVERIREPVNGGTDIGQQFAEMEAAIVARAALAEDLVRLRREDTPAAVVLMASNQGADLMLVVKRRVDAFRQAVNDRIAGQQADLRRSRGIAYLLTSATAMAGMLVVGLAAGLTLRENRRRHVAEMALRDSARRLRSALHDHQRVMDHSLDVICTMDSEGRFVSVGRASETVWGYSPEEICGRKYMDFVLPEDREMTAAAAANIATGHATRDFRNRYVRKDGSVVPMLWASVWSPEDGLFFSVARDITELHRAEATQREAKLAAEEANRAKSQFLANMSHELRTPLNAIIGFSEILSDQTFGPLNPRQTRYVGNVLSSGRHLLQLINDILDLAKVEAGRMELFPEPFSPTRAIEDVLAVVKALAEKKGIGLVTDFAPHIPQIVADQGKFKQVLYNLLSNAVKFTPERGLVTVRAQLAGPVSPPGTSVLWVSVTDNGIGIKAGDLQRLFVEFEQIDSTYARRQGGTGLGLALTKKLVGLHGGRIWVNSDGEGLGSTFTFELPLGAPRTPGAPHDHSGTAEPAAVPEASGRETGEELPVRATAAPRPVVLVVEDDEKAVTLLENYLGSGGYEVVVARTAAEALSLARLSRPYAITLDIMLPDRNGWEVLREFKADPATQGIPVVIVSITDDKQLAYSAGALDFLIKPVRREQLLGILDRIGRTTGGRVRKVLIVDDKPESVEPLAGILRADGCTVYLAASGAEGLAFAVERGIDLAILDLLMPGMSGFELVERLRLNPRTSGIPVLIYTSADLSSAERAQLLRQVQGISDKSSNGQLLAHLARLGAVAPRP